MDKNTTDNMDLIGWESGQWDTFGLSCILNMSWFFPLRKHQVMAVAAHYRRHRITFSGNEGTKMYYINVYRGYDF